MDKFRTIVDVPQTAEKIGHDNKVMFIGSCFSESIGQKLASHKFHVDINPFGVLYNPASIAQCLSILLKNKFFSEEDLNYANERWFSFLHHSDYSRPDKTECLEAINTRIRKSAQFLENADYIFITFGTSWIFKQRQNNSVVSNCHKLPASKFIRSKLSVEDIVSEYQSLLDQLKQFNSKLKAVFTISPIRHWKDGAHGNQLSKATLFVALEKIVEANPEVAYFPSYEIMMDELRDYRFYSADMLHINQVAIDYIYERFSECFFSDETKKLNSKVEKIIRASNHRPFNPNAENFRDFVKSNINEIESLLNLYPYLDFIPEMNYFKSLLKTEL